jgi:hypothetical protein
MQLLQEAEQFLATVVARGHGSLANALDQYDMGVCFRTLLGTHSIYAAALH